MAVEVSLQLPIQEFGVSRNYGRRSYRFKSSEVKSCRHLHLPSLSLSSSRALRQDIWSVNVTEKIYRPLHYFPCNYSLLTCRCSAKPSDGLPLLKNAILALPRSFDVLKESFFASKSYAALKGSPVMIQLASAIGVIAFAVWALGPLMRYSRNLFLRQNDTNWKKSKTYYIVTSYLQPLLLWTGVTLVCRSLYPVVLSSVASQAVKQRLLKFVQSLASVLALAYCLTRLIQQTQNFFIEKNGSDDKRNVGFQFVAKLVYTCVWLGALALFMELLGFKTQKWLTAGGLGTVMLTLAGREIFTNFLSSIMIHATRPFVQNEWIQAKIEGIEVSGTVERIGWWGPTIVRGDDREAIHIPNHQFTVNILRNLSQKTHWRIKTHLAISHLDVNKISNIVADMRKVLAKNPQIEQQKLHRRVFLENVNPENQALLILISCFVKTSHFEEYLCVKESVLLDLLRVVSHHRARLATPIRTVQKVYSDADIDNIPYSETIFTRAEAAINRPLLLIEPSYRINGEEKTKPRTTARSNEETARSNEEQTAKSSASTEPKPATGSDGDLTPGTTSPSKLQLEGSEKPPLAETGSEHVEVSVPPMAKKEGERPASSPSTTKATFPNNLVLEVALEGSKKTLPIEEGIPPVPLSEEPSEMAASRGAHVSSSSSNAKDKKGQVSTGDQRDQER